MDNTQDNGTIPSSRKMWLGGLSLALYWGCALLGAGADAVSIHAGSLWHPMAGCIGLLASLFVFGAAPQAIASKAGGIIVRALIILGPVIYGATVLLSPNPFGAAPAGARLLLGLALGFTLAHLGSFLAHCPRFQGVVIATASFLVGSVIYLICSGFIVACGGVVLAALSFVSGLAFLLAGFDERGRVQPVGGSAVAKEATASTAFSLPKGFWSLFMGLLLYSAVYGITISLTLDAGRGQAHSTPLELVLLVPGVIFLLAVLRFHEGLDFRHFQWFLFAPSAIALLILPFADDTVALVCCGILVLMFSFFDLASFVLLVDLARNRGTALAMRIFAWGRFANVLGIAVGWGVAMPILGSGLDGQGQSVVILAFLGVAIVVVLMTFFGNTSFLSPAAPPEVPDDMAGAVEAGDFESRCASIAEAHGLSTRETELFNLFARGRSTTYIADSLCLAPSTVKTHAYRIYRKLGVHSKQELIDLVESENR